MNMIKLTGLSHPDIQDGKCLPLYIDADRILVISRVKTQLYREGSAEEARAVNARLAEELDRVTGEISRLKLDLEDPEFTKSRFTLQTAAGALTNVYNQINRLNTGPQFYPRQECTEVSLACGTADHAVMLARHYVTETPEEVFGLMAPYGRLVK